MAGFQQAANALTGAVGTVANRVGLYGELVGKNREYRAQLEEQNAALKKLNEDLEAKQGELETANATISDQAEQLAAKIEEKRVKHNMSSKLSRERKKSEARRLERALSNNQAYMSKAMAYTLLYGDFASGSGGI